jgi:hypothetical protein
MRRASWSLPSAFWQRGPTYGAAASRVDVVHREI